MKALATPTKTIDVTHVIPYMHPKSGGPPVVVDRLCRQLVKRDFRVRVVTTDLFAQDETTTAWAEPFRSAYAMDVYPASGPGSFGYSRALKLQMESIVAQSRLVVLHTVWTYVSLVAAKACQRQGVPYLVMPHGMLDPASMGRKPWKKQLYGSLFEWRNLRRAAGMIYTHAEEERLAAESVSGLPRSFLMPLGADEPPVASRDELAGEFFAAHPELKDRELVVFLGRLHSKKGLDLLIPAMQTLAHARPAAHLVLVGQGSPEYERELHALAAKWNVAGRITWTGSLSGREKWAALSAGKVFALPSYQENFALVVVEALRLGLPVVLSRRVNICPDIVQAGAGLECALNPVSVAETLTEYLEHPQLAHEAGERGQALVAQHYTWPRAADRFVEIYHQVIDQNH